MRIIGPLKRKQGLPPLLSDDGKDRSVLESLKVNRTLEFNASTMKGGKEMVTCLLTMETFHRNVSKVERTLESDALNELDDLRGVISH